MAGVRSTFVDLNFASLSTITGFAMADELIDSVFTSTMDTRICRAFIDIAQTPRIVIASKTLTLEAVNEIDADSIVCARR